MNPTLSFTRRTATLGVSLALAMALAAPAVLATPPEHVLERARRAVTEGGQAAEDLAGPDAPGVDEKARGLERASEAIEAAAARKAAREGTEFPGKGKALGRVHADLVHEYLAAGESPSVLAPHGEAVSSLAKAFEKIKADHPGLGRGLDKERPARGADDGDEVDADDD